jgi:hypothetical protein
MTTPDSNEDLKAQLAGALRAAGIAPDVARVEALLPAYQGILAGAARMRDLDLGETEPAVVFRLPDREA